MYGPLDHFEVERSHALGALIMKVFNAKKNNYNFIDVWGTGKPIREWLYVEDGAKALVKALNLDPGHHFFNVGSGIGHSVIDIAKKIAKEFEWDGEFKLDRTKPDGVPEKKVDPNLGEKILGWLPEVSIDEGIKLTVEWFIENEKNITYNADTEEVYINLKQENFMRSKVGWSTNDYVASRDNQYCRSGYGDQILGVDIQTERFQVPMPWHAIGIGNFLLTKEVSLNYTENKFERKEVSLNYKETLP